MNLQKYIYVSPQQYIKVLKEWNYEYITHRAFRRTPTFGYHQGKDVIKNLEIEAWRTNRNIRMLNQFQWRDLRYTLLGGKYIAEDGGKIIFNSKSQFERFLKEMSSTFCMVKPLRQLSSGEILLQKIIENNGRYHGHLKIIGNRGGIRTENGYSVAHNYGDPYLVRTIGSLFE